MREKRPSQTASSLHMAARSLAFVAVDFEADSLVARLEAAEASGRSRRRR